MRGPFVIVLALGLALAGAAVWMVNGYLQSAAAAAPVPTIDMTRVFAAKRDLRYGETVRPEDVKLIAWPTADLPEGILVLSDEGDELFPEGGPREREVLRAMDEGEVLLASKVTEPGGEAGITSQLEVGMRAFSINVDVTSGVSGFLRPGDNVDVFWTGQIQGRETTRLVQAGVSIIAVDQSADMDTNATQVARTIAVAVTPRDVAALTHAQSTGRLTLSLVGVNDDGPAAEAVEVDSKILFGIEDVPEPEVVAEAPAEVCSVRTRRGGEMVEVQIDCPE